MLSNEKMEAQVKKKVLLGAMLAVGLFASMTVWSPMEVWAEDDAGVEAISVEPDAEENAEEKPAVWLQIQPTAVRMGLKPGDVVEQEFKVSNIGSGDFTFKVYAAPYSVIGDDYQNNFSNETNYTQISRWISFEQSEYRLAVGEEQVVKFKVTVPEDVAAGGQYAVVFAEAEGDTGGMEVSSSTGGSVKAVSRVGLVIYASVAGETRNESEIADFELPTMLFSFDAPDVTAHARVKNTGNVDFEAKYSLKVNYFFGGGEAYTEEKTYLIFPETERFVEMAWEGTPLLGFFNVTFSVTAGGKTEEVTKFVMVLPPWVLILAIVVLTILIVGITLMVVERKKRKKSGFRV